MEVILNIVISNLQMVGIFMIPFVFMRIADICFGVVLSFKDINLSFSWKKLLGGILWGALVGLGIICLSCGASTLPAILTLYEITIVDVEALSSMVDIVAIVGVIITSILTYGKDAYLKMIKVFKIDNQNDIVDIRRINEDGEEDVSYS